MLLWSALEKEEINMRVIPTFVDGNFHGYDTLKEIMRLRSEGYI